MSSERARYADPGPTGGSDFGLLDAALATCASRHPYLLFDKRAAARICQRAKRSPRLLARLEASLHESSPALAEQGQRTRIKRQARRLIHTSFLALLDKKNTKQAALHETRVGLLRFTAAKSWKIRPAIKSFLDCAEIAVAVSLSYDWLYEEFSPEERRILEAALLRHVLEPALAAYSDRFAVWPKRRDNCTLVSNCGILFASLAVLQRYPEIALPLIRTIFRSSWVIFEALAPDGAWPEGPSYWSLAMRYAGLMVAALESTLGQSFGLADRPGLAQTGDFALHTVGPFGAAFNFADSELTVDTSPLIWFAHRYRRRMDALLVDSYDGWFLPFTAIWARRPGGRTPPQPPTGKIFHSGDLVCFRNTWSQAPTARPVYLAIKGGNVRGRKSGQRTRAEDVPLHAQADAGSFIIDGARQRWIMDLGPDDYDLPGYFDHGTDDWPGPRWQYYRTGTAGHNTLVIDGCNQIPSARVPITDVCVDGPCKRAVIDLSAAYGIAAGSIRRGAALIGRHVLIQDEVGPEVAGRIVWTVHTSAEPVSMSASVACFRSGDDRLLIRILEPDEARFELGLPPEPRRFPLADVRQLHGRTLLADNAAWISELPRCSDDRGKHAGGAVIRRLQIVWPSGARRLRVLFLPDCDGEEPALPIVPLNRWFAGRRRALLSPDHVAKHRCADPMPNSGEPPMDARVLPLHRQGTVVRP